MKHAFLIIAHNEFDILKYQLKLLDAPNTAFYIHIDKRANYNELELRNCISFSYIEFIPSRKIKWGSYSQIDCELRLLKAAAHKNYDYYHLISGVDMPLHTIPEMDALLIQNMGKDYVHFDKSKVDQSIKERIQFYHIMPGRKQWQKKLNGLFVHVQRWLKVDRLKGSNIVIQKGANWFSITDRLVKDLLQNEQELKKRFRWSFCGDELFLQTYIFNTKNKEFLISLDLDNNYERCLREIDWTRGNPYVFRESDFERLMKSKCLFARKFDSHLDSMIIKKIYLKLSGEL